MRSLPLLALLISVVSASASIRPISFTHGATGGLAALHGYYNPDFGQGYTGFSLNTAVPGFPPVSYSVRVTPTLPNLPNALWISPPAPFAEYVFDVPVWSSPPAVEEGRWQSFSMQLHAKLAVDAFTPGSPSVNIKFEFETTEIMDFTVSGLYFYGASGMPITPPVDEMGRLPPGRYIVGNFNSPGFGPSSKGVDEKSFSLILGPVPPDTDGDGLSDYDELHTYGSDPNNGDTDSDGLGDYEEVRTHHTNPANRDTDGDGFTDQFELRTGMSPLDPLSVPATSLTIHPAVELRVTTKLGTQYRVQSSSDLQTWVDTQNVIEGTGDEVRWVYETVDSVAKYWRVREVK